MSLSVSSLGLCSALLSSALAARSPLPNPLSSGPQR
jgi:hypothetical protein